MATATQPAIYRGDEALSALLRSSDSSLNINQVRRIVEGSLAAPEAEDRTAWMSLIAERRDPALEGQLAALRTEMGAKSGAARQTAPATSGARLAAVQHELSRAALDGFLVPRTDEYQNEYIPAAAERMAWLTGFTGSAGMAVVLRDRAAVFSDGRYTLQLRQQVDGRHFEHRHITDAPPERWLADHFPEGGKLGFDPWLHTADGLTAIREAVSRKGGSLVAVARNPIDAVWTDRPVAPISPVLPHRPEHAGRESVEKREALAAELRKSGHAAAVITQPTSLAWLLNIRGADVPHTPLPLGFALLHDDGAVELFIDKLKLAPGLERHLGNGVVVAPIEDLAAGLDRLGKLKARVLVDRSSACLWLTERLRAAGAEAEAGEDPCALPRACKNPVELAGSRNAHHRDGAAMARFLRWFEAEAPRGQLDEIAVAERLLEFRRQDPLFRDVSFDTIAGSGPNGAIVHYRATPETARKIGMDEMFLLDSGAQYLDGTTDITRTLIVGQPSAEMRDRFTRVLKGHIALGRAIFPKGTSGSQLDALARQPLWEIGLDYDHGTGHGVGSYLSVHEGPQRISKVPNRVALRPGMILSNEPGFYKTGAYGIRIENLVEVVERPAAQGPMLGFENLTLAPIDRRLIARELMTAAETAWLDAYHARIRAEIAPLLDPQTGDWLVGATAPLGQ